MALAPMLAGCLGGDATETAAAAAAPVEVEPGLIVAADKGVLDVLVVNDAGLVVQGARVSLVGTDHFEDTNTSGLVRFINVTAGDHTLIVQSTGFQPHQQPVQVQAANITLAEVVLLPDSSRGAGYVPHVHDYWGERTEHILMDEAVDITQPSGDYSVHPVYDLVLNMVVRPNNNNDYKIRVPTLDDGTPNLVYPGAGEVRVTFRWETTDTQIEELRLRYSPPAADSVTLEPKRSGETWSIPVTPVTMDYGHQQQTEWDFWIKWDNVPTEGATYRPAVNVGEIDVEIVIIKGSDPPLEPPHPDFWADGDVLLLRSADDELVWQYPDRSRAGSSMLFFLPDETIVPPGTTMLRFVFTWRYDGAAHGTILDQEHTVIWRTAAHSPYAHFPEWDRHEPAVTGDHMKEFHVELAPGEADEFYQRESWWTWSPGRVGAEDETLDPSPSVRRFTLEVTAYRTLAAFEAATA